MLSALPASTRGPLPTHPAAEGSGAMWGALLARRLSEVKAQGAEALPAYPAVALRVQSLLEDRSDLSEVARVIGADAALAVDVLRCANSAMYRRETRVTTIAQAIAQIGTKQVLKLALASGLAAKALAAGPLAPLRRRYWLESLSGAAICRGLSQVRHLPAEKGFLLGLLHDFGRIVALASLEPLCRERPAGPPIPADTLRDVIEAHHVDLAVALARHWHLPDLLVGVIEAHHRDWHPKDAPLLRTVMASDQIVSLLARGPSVPECDLAALPGLDGETEVKLALRLVAQVPEFVASFEPEPLAAEVPQISVTRVPPRSIPPRETELRVKVILGLRSLEYRGIALDRRGLLVEGAAPLPENRLVRVTLSGAHGSFELWCLSEETHLTAGNPMRFELRPFALDGEAQARWSDLTSE